MGLKTSISNHTVYYWGWVHCHVTGTAWCHSHHEPLTGNEGVKLQGCLYQTLCILQGIWRQYRSPGTCMASKAMPKDQAHKCLLSSLFANTCKRGLSRSSPSAPKTRLLMHSQKLWHKTTSNVIAALCAVGNLFKPPKWGSACHRPIILRTVQGYFWCARPRSDTIRVTKPDRWVRSEVLSPTPHRDMRWQVHHIITTSSLHSYIGAQYWTDQHIRIHVHLFGGPCKIHMHSG